MRIPIRRMGNSQGLILPKPVLAQIGLEDEVDLKVEGDALVLRKPKGAPRAGWAEAARSLAAAGDDALVMPELPLDEDDELTW